MVSIDPFVSPAASSSATSPRFSRVELEDSDGSRRKYRALSLRASRRRTGSRREGVGDERPERPAGGDRARVAVAPIVFAWYAQVAETGDVGDDPSIAWPEIRRLVKLGTVMINKVDAEQMKTDKALLFLPGQLQAGIEIVDPVISMRNAAYPISFGARQ